MLIARGERSSRGDSGTPSGSKVYLKSDPRNFPRVGRMEMLGIVGEETGEEQGLSSYVLVK